MTDKLVQEIYINEDTDETPDTNKKTIKKEYTIDELCELVAPTFCINSYYAGIDSKYWIWQKKEKFDSEKWRKCPNYRGYKASNYGRIQKYGEILIPKDKNFENIEQIKEEIKNNPCSSKVGWLNVNSNSVHILVADAWLKPYEGKIPNGETIEVHHISNDGYDNSPYNLIYLLKNKEHSKVHSGKLCGKIVPFNYCYPGPKKK